ncbi:MAG: hypothetical protein AAGF20_07960 [Pseudomonadota bacterium]
MTEKTFEITLSGEALTWLEAEIRDGSYHDASEMVQALVQRDLDALGALLMEGEESGISPRSADEIFEGLKRRRNNAA